MKISTRIIVLIVLSVILTSISLSMFSIYALNQSGKKEIALIEKLRSKHINKIKENGKKQVKAFRNELLKNKKEYLKSHIDLAISALKTYLKEYQNISETEKHSGALELMRGLRYGPELKDYIFINDMNAKSVMHPYKPQIEGKDFSNFKDAKGKKHVVEMVDVCKKNEQGFVVYYWPKYGSDQAQPKLSFVKLFKKWNWIIGSGVYIDYIDAKVSLKQAGFDNQVKQASNEMQKQLNLIKAKIEKDINKLIIFIILITLLVLFISLIFFYFCTKSKLMKPMEELVDFAQSLSGNDFSKELKIQQKDEIGILAESLNKMKNNLQIRNIKIKENMSDMNEILTYIELVTEKIVPRSDQVFESSKSLSDGTSAQVESLEKISNAIIEISMQTKTNAENANQANLLAQEATKVAEQGDQQMKAMVKAMERISDASKDIARIIKTIDGIAFQTNLLALNAAVEAARAGQYGKGFAVVAEEVRNLAGRSALAALETTELIEDSIDKIINGTEIATKTSTSLKKIVNETIHVTELIGKIAVSSKEQASGISEVNNAISQIDSITIQSADSAVKTANTTQKLAEQTSHLQQTLSRFKMKNASEI
ncbi:methyl-accepting chemotaxis protein [Candidatus Magnetomoraceae bacterium gMMP-1]